jgi:hypothetical protein
MDPFKYPIEHLFDFVAGVIPGFTALISFLGYKTKLFLILVVAFVIGNNMTTFLRAL